MEQALTSLRTDMVANRQPSNCDPVARTQAGEATAAWSMGGWIDGRPALQSQSMAAKRAPPSRAAMT